MEKEIKFKDIRVGDTIRCEFMNDDLAITHSATVAKVNESSAYTESGKRLIDAVWGGGTYILVDRPKPPLPAEQGSRIKVTKFRGGNGEWLARLDGGGRWSLFDLIGEDDEFWTNQCHIEEWHHVEIFEVTP